MKKIAKSLLLLALALILVFSVIACEKDDGTDSEKKDSGAVENNDDKQETEKTVAGVFAVNYKGVNVELGSKAKPILEKLGEPLSSNFVASCGEGSGDQWVYAYSSVFIYTLKVDDEEIIDGLKLRDDTVDTSKDIRIGATKTSVKNAYGDNIIEKENRLLYQENFYVIEFSIDSNDTVTGIELRTETN